MLRRCLAALAVASVLCLGGVAWAAFAGTTSNSGNTLASASSFKACDYPATIGATAGLVNYWRLGEASGTSAADSKGASTGTYVGAPTLGASDFIAGDSNTAVSFDGSNDEMTAPGTVLTSVGSIEGWFNWTSGTTLMRDNTGVSGVGWLLAFDSGGNVAYRVGDTTFTTTQTTASLRGAWHHIALTVSGGNTAFYVDGALVHSGTGAGSSVSQAPWHVMRNGSSTPYATGTADEVAIYNTALSAATVQAHFQCGRRYRDAVMDTSGLVGYWRLSEPLADVAFDSKGTNDGSYENGPTLGAAGALTASGDTAASFDGVDDYANVPSDATLNLTSAITVEAWAKPSSVSDKLVVSRRNASGYAWEMGFATTGAAIARINANTNEARTSTIYTTGSWYHLALTYDQATIRLYVNGQQQATFAYTGAITTPAIPVMIGRRGNTGAESWFNGTIDEVAVYNRALSAGEIAAHYDAR